jgi:hypothetical protein
MRGPDYLLNWFFDLLEATLLPKFRGNVTPLKTPKTPQKTCQKTDSREKKEKRC